MVLASLRGTLLPLAVLALDLPGRAQSQKLNAPLPRTIGGDVLTAGFSLHGQHVFVLSVEPGSPYTLAMRSASPSGIGPSYLLSPEMLDVEAWVEQSLDGSTLAFVTGGFCGGSLYTTTPDGMSSPLFLGTVGTDCDGYVPLELSPDGSWVVYRGYEMGLFPRMYAVPTDGSQPAHQVDSGSMRVWTFDATSQHVFYVDPGAGSFELKRAPLDGSSMPVVLGTEVTGLFDFRSTPDLEHVLYRAEQETSGVRELFSIDVQPLAPAVKLNQDLAAGGDVGSYAVSPDSQWVVYVADAEADEVHQLYRAAVDGQGAPVRLTAPANHPVSFQRIGVTADNRHVVFWADYYLDGVAELFSVPLVGGASPTRLNGPLVAGGSIVDYELAPDGTTVVYRAEQEMVGRRELYATRVGGFRPRPGTRWVRGEPFVKISGPLGPGGTVWHYDIGGNGEYVAYRAVQAAGEPRRLYGTPIDGTAAPVLLSDPEYSNNSVIVSPTEDRVLFQDFVEGSIRGAWVAPIDGTTPPELVVEDYPTGPPGGEVEAFALSADGRTTVFIAPGETNYVNELFVVPTDGSATPLRLNRDASGGGSVVGSGDLLVTADGTRAIYVADVLGEGAVEIFSVETGGLGNPVRLNGPLVEGGTVSDRFRSSPDEASVVFVADALTHEVHELFVAPADGSSPAIKIEHPLGSAEDVLDDSVDFTSDSSRIVYLAGRIDDPELYSVPRDGSEAPIHLTESTSNRLITDHAVSADGIWTVFLAEVVSNGIQRIYSRPVDGSAPQRLLSNPTSGDEDVLSFSIDPTSNYVVFRGDTDTDEVFELFSSPIDDSSPAVNLSGPLVANGDVTTPYSITPDGQKVLFVADKDTDGVEELYGVPITGGTPTKLNPSFPSGARVDALTISPNSRWVVYRADALANGQNHLYSVPITGGPSIRLDGQHILGPTMFFITEQSDQLVYSAGALYSVPVRGEGPPRILHEDAGPAGISARQAGSTRFVVFRNDLDDPGFDELFSVRLPGGLRPSAPPPDSVTRDISTD